MGLIIEAAACPCPLSCHLLPASLKRLRARVQRGLALALSLAVAGGAQAQVVDDVDVRREGADAVLSIGFVTPVQYQRSVLARSGDQVLVYYRVLPTRQTLELNTAERRLPARAGTAGGPGLPAVTVTDEAAPGSDAERRLLVRLSAPLTVKVRAGRGGRSIELWMSGRGSQVGLAVVPADLPPLLAGRWRVTLQATDAAGAALASPIPSSLQDVNVYTTRRVDAGRTLYATHLGPFATRAEAMSALTALRGRFPAAEVTAVDDGARVTPAAVPPSPQAVPGEGVAAALPLAPQTGPAASTQSATAAEPAWVASAAAASAPVAAAAASAAASAPAVAASATVASATAASAPAVAAPVPAPPAAAVAAPALPVDTDLDRRATAQLAAAREALARGDTNAAIDGLSALLDLPPNLSSRAAQALIGQARLKAGDTGRARAEFDAFLRLYPAGPDADQVRAALAAMSPPEAAAATGGGRRVASTTLTGSVGSTYYGGQSKVRTQEFQDSLLGGLPELISDNTLSSADQKQIVSTVDVNWRHRDADVDQRFVFRDAYTRDILRPERNRNKLSSLYFDHRSFKRGTQVRLGRQSPLGGGVLGRFDGVQASYAFRSRWKAGVVAGVPTDELLDTRRRFWGASVEAEALTPQFGASLYTVQQTIDGEVDRRAIGSEMRYFDGGVSGNAQLDYDVLLKGLNIASVQGTWQRPDNTVFNLLYDRRMQPLLSLGNTLFFTDPNLLVRPTRVSELLQTSTLEQLRERARATTAVSTQAALGVTTPIHPQWQAGADLRYTSTGAVAPVPDILPTGLPASGDIWSVSLQLIGTNLYSPRDTHVVIVNFVNGPTFQGKLLSYNNSSLVFGTWQLEPSLKLYRQSDSTGTTSSRWSPGLRLTWRVVPQAAAEAEINVENSKTSGPMRNESSSRSFFYVGGRVDF